MRFVSLTNMSRPGIGDPGEVVTKPIVVSGDALHLNATVRPEGVVTVTVLDEAGAPIPGFVSTPVHGDKLDNTVQFKNGAKVANLKGRTVKLRFSVVNADLYSYWIA